jgi:type I restriction enzyme S subunit
MSTHPAIPKSWEWSTMSVACEKIQDGTHFSPHATKQLADGPHPYVTAKNVRPSGLDLTDITFLAEPDHRQIYERCDPKPGDVLLVKDGVNAGDAAINTFEGEISLLSSVSMLRPHKNMLSAGFLRYYLLSPQGHRSLIGELTGTAIKRIILRKIREMPVPIAPLPEQRLIVDKVEEMFSDLDAGIAALERAKANLKRYRAAVLKAAIEGKLTEAWRAEHPNTEPASILLERILAERHRKWEAAQLAKFAATEREPPKNWREKYVELTSPVTTGLPALPAGWCWASVQQVGSVQLGRQRAPQNHTGPHMHPYLRVANVFEDRIDLSDVMEMNFTPREFETFRLSYGDILLNEGQSMELVGRPAMYRDEMPGVCFTNSLVRFRVYDGVDTDYALKVFLAYLKNGRFQRIATITVNIAHLGAGRFSEIEFPLPPMEEQAAISEEVDRHFSLIDAAEKAITLSQARATHLRQSILKQAFEGKLVPQNPTDEPASVLLEQLRTSRSVQTTNGRPTTRIRDKSKRKAARDDA